MAHKQFVSFPAVVLVVLAMTVIGCNSGGGGNNPVSSTSSSSKQLTEFHFESPAGIGVIDESAKTVSVTVPYGTDVTSLIAFFSTTGAETTVNGEEQESGVTENDFSTPVTYRVTAEDDSTVDYTVTVIVAENDAKDITSFTIEGQSDSVIIGTDITVIMPYGTDVSSLSPAIIHTGASINPASGQAQDFTNPVVYTVTAEDSSIKEYTVTVSAPEEATMIFDFMTDGDALVREDGSDWYFDGGNTGNYSYGYYMNQTNIAAPWLFTGDFTVEFEFYLKVLTDENIYRYAFRLVDPNWESNTNRKYFDFAAYYTAFPADDDAYYQINQGNGSYSSTEYSGNVPGVVSGINTCTMLKVGNMVSVYMNSTHVRTVTINSNNLPYIGYAPFIHGHNSWDQAESNFYLRTVTVHYISDQIEYHNWNE